MVIVPIWHTKSAKLKLMSARLKANEVGVGVPNGLHARINECLSVSAASSRSTGARLTRKDCYSALSAPADTPEGKDDPERSRYGVSLVSQKEYVV